MFRILPVLLFFAFFWTVLFGDRQFGYRDGAHYYYPLYRYVQEEISAGRLPLWNPYENLGQPLAANPTTALFYPGKLIFFLPFDFTTLYGWFVSGHILLAAFLAYRLAKAWRCSTEAATLAGICYAFGGNVLFQHANIPFLIGAAWFPEALLQADRMFRLKSFENAALWGTSLALMILGGDPQAAYHAILCTILLFVVNKTPPGAYVPGSVLLVVGLLTMFSFAAVQILPAWELSRLSDRSLPTHVDSIYLFSVPIWRFVEFFWPNAGGVEFPINARWFHGDDVWVPSFYMGLVPMMLAVWNMRFRVKEPGTERQRSPRTRDVFLTLMLMVFVLGSLGPWGGVYPLLQWLPGYGMFRFPAKLLTVAALPIAILAARGFDRLFNDGRFVDRFYYSLLTIGIPVFALTGWVSSHTPCLEMLDLPVPSCPLWGLFDAKTAFYVAVGSIFQIVFLFFLCLLPWKENKEPLSARWVLFFLLLITLDLFLANRWMVATVPRDDFQEKSPLVNRVRGTVTTGHGSLCQRIYRFPTWYPLAFKDTSSKNRLSEIVRWEQATLSPKYSLSERIGVVDVLGTMYPKDFYRIAGGLRWEIEHGEPGDLEKRLESLSVEYVLAPWGRELDAEKIPLELPLSANVRLWKLRNPRVRNYAVFEPNRLEMDVELAEPGTVTVPEQYFPGWRAFVGNKEYPIHPVDKIFRGVDLPVGKHRLRMIYQPLMFQIGGTISCLGVIILMGTSIYYWEPRKIRKKSRDLCFRRQEPEPVVPVLKNKGMLAVSES